MLKGNCSDVIHAKIQLILTEQSMENQFKIDRKKLRAIENKKYWIQQSLSSVVLFLKFYWFFKQSLYA